MLAPWVKWLLAGMLSLCLNSLADGQEAGATAAKTSHEVYISRINGSRFWGLYSDDYSVASLLTSPLAADLDLSSEQVDKLRSIYMPLAQRNIDLMMRLRSPSLLQEGEERSIRAEQAVLISELNKAMAEVLNDGQRKRLEQISLQVGGPHTLIVEPRLLLQLGLSDPQRDKLKTIIAEMWIDEARLKEDYRSKHTPPAEVGLAIQQGRERAIQRVIEILKPNQVSILESLLGEPYDVGKLRPDERYLRPVPWWHGVARIETKQ